MYTSEMQAILSLPGSSVEAAMSMYSFLVQRSSHPYAASRLEALLPTANATCSSLRSINVLPLRGDTFA